MILKKSLLMTVIVMSSTTTVYAVAGHGGAMQNPDGAKKRHQVSQPSDRPDHKPDKTNGQADPSVYNQYHNFLQFNLMQSIDARMPGQARNDTYLETEFGGRSGIVDLYGYLDVFDIVHNRHDDRHDGDNMFFKIRPRFSINGLINRNLQIGPVKEWFIATQSEVGDRELFNNYIGIGANVDVPVMGTVGVNLMARYVQENYSAPNENHWDGYKLATNWFTPFYTFSNDSFLSYQGYFDWSFAMDAYNATRSNHALEWYNGLYWHSRHFSVGYGLKYFNDMTGVKDGSMMNGQKQDTTGWGSYFAVSYVFT